MNVGTEQTTTERQTLTASMQAGIRGSDAMSAMGMMLPTPTLSVADPVALARQQQAAVAQSPAAPASPAPPVPRALSKGN